MKNIKLIITTEYNIEKIKNYLNASETNYFKQKIKKNPIDKDKDNIMTYEYNESYVILFIIKKDAYTLEEIQNISAKSIKNCISVIELNSIKQSVINIHVDNKSFNQYEINVIEKGIWLAYYAYRDKNNFKKNNKTKVNIQIKGLNNKEIQIISEYIHKLRIMVSTPTNQLDTQHFIEESYKIAKENNLKIKVLRKKDLKKENMNLLLAVGAGSQHEPALIVFEYTPKNVSNNEKPIVLIGKGLMYDSGGLHLKPDGYMKEMYGDMAGAGTVAICMSMLKKLNINKKVIGICAVAENMVDEDSYRNGDIYTAKNGLTVEIEHTDAEGRLVLADALVYADEKYNPKLIIDIATLTGGCLIALGEMYSAIFSDNKNIINEFIKIGEKINDWVWPLPLNTQIKEMMKNDKADLSNMNKVKGVLSTSSGAAFLSYFVKDTKKWVHLDIAGTGMRSKSKREYDIPNMVGSGGSLHLIIEFLKTYK